MDARIRRGWKQSAVTHRQPGSCTNTINVGTSNGNGNGGGIGDITENRELVLIGGALVLALVLSQT